MSLLLPHILLYGQVCTVTFKLSGLPREANISLIPFAPYELPALAEASLEKGKGVITLDLSEPREFSIKVDGQWANERFMLEPGKITIKATVERKETERGAYYQWTDVAVTGSKSDDYLKAQMAIKEDLNKLYEAKNTKYADVMAAVGKARQDKDSMTMDSLMNTPRYNELQQAEKDFFAAVKKSYDEVLERNKETFWGPLMMLNLYAFLSPDNRPDFEAMADQAKNSYYGDLVRERLYPANQAGEKVPDFTTHDREGKAYSLADLLQNKRVLLIDFWASWCGPCKKEIPNLKKNYARYADKGFEIVSISIDQNEAAWVRALESNQLPWPNFLDRDVSNLYKVSAVPTTYLVDGEGRLLAENLRGEELEAKLRELFE